MYFLCEKLGLAIGSGRFPLRPVYSEVTPIKFSANAQMRNNLEIEPIIYDGSDIELPSYLEENINILERKFKDYFLIKANEIDYERFLSKIAIGVMNLYLTTDKELRKLEDETSAITIGQIDKVVNSIEKTIKEIEQLFQHRPIEALTNKKGIDQLAINLMQISYRGWSEQNLSTEFSVLKSEVKKLFDEAPKVSGERDYGSMMIYYTIFDYYNSMEYKSTPASLEDFPYHYKDETRHLNPSSDIFCQFLAYQITSLFAGIKTEPSGRFQELKYKSGFTEDIMTILDDEKYYQDLYYTFERQSHPVESYSFEKKLIPVLEPYMKKHLLQIREGQPLNYDKLAILLRKVKKDEILMREIDKKRLKLPIRKNKK